MSKLEHNHNLLAKSQEKEVKLQGELRSLQEERSDLTKKNEDLELERQGLLNVVNVHMADPNFTAKFDAAMTSGSDADSESSEARPPAKRSKSQTRGGLRRAEWLTARPSPLQPVIGQWEGEIANMSPQVFAHLPPPADAGRSTETRTATTPGGGCPPGGLRRRRSGWLRRPLGRSLGMTAIGVQVGWLPLFLRTVLIPEVGYAPPDALRLAAGNLGQRRGALEVHHGDHSSVHAEQMFTNWSSTQGDAGRTDTLRRPGTVVAGSKARTSPGPARRCTRSGISKVVGHKHVDSGDQPHPPYSRPKGAPRSASPIASDTSMSERTALLQQAQVLQRLSRGLAATTITSALWHGEPWEKRAKPPQQQSELPNESDKEQYPSRREEAEEHPPRRSLRRYYLTIPTGWLRYATTGNHQVATTPDTFHIANHGPTRARELAWLHTTALREFHRILINEVTVRNNTTTAAPPRGNDHGRPRTGRFPRRRQRPQPLWPNHRGIFEGQGRSAATSIAPDRFGAGNRQ